MTFHGLKINPASSVTIASLALALLFGSSGRSHAAPKPTKFRVYVGTYTDGESKGIYLMELDPRVGTLTEPVLAAESVNPSFLALHPNGRFLYAVGETGAFRGEKSGSVSAFAIDPKDGMLTLLNQQPSVGSGPCHLVVDGPGKNVLVANYGGGSVAALPIDADGKLRKASAFIQHRGSGADPNRQKGPHAHSINVDAAGRFAIAADLGLDKLLVYRLDSEDGSLEPNNPRFASVAPKSGPRHFAFHPNGRFGYVINEMANTVTAFGYDAKRGVLAELQTIDTLPKGFNGRSSTAEIVVHPKGKFLFGSNRGHDSIAIFAIDPKSGKLTALGHEPTGGKAPRNFAIDPTGYCLLAENQNSDSIYVFLIHPHTGKLGRSGQVVTIPSPVCVKFLAIEE